ncbi:uncharacterized protein isoform X2 [Rhodnius prolixus]|uniref:uncharacterized protein isoform X2 n=1 Tax=Rhodnius prolixus TaxID=13249 RepID=UPI003D18D77E
MSKNPDIFNKTNRNDRLKQMSQQQQLIEEKKRQIQKKFEEQRRREAEEALRSSKGDQLGSEEKLNPNVFSNDGSFLDQFRKLAGREGGIENREDQKQNRDRSRSPCSINDSDHYKQNQQHLHQPQQIGQHYLQMDHHFQQQVQQMQQQRHIHQQQQMLMQPRQDQRQQLLLMARAPPPPPPLPLPQNIPAPSPLLPQSIPPPSPINPQSIPPPTPLVPQSIPPPCPVPPVPPPLMSLPTPNYNLPPSLLAPPPPPPPPMPPCIPLMPPSDKLTFLPLNNPLTAQPVLDSGNYSLPTSNSSAKTASDDLIYSPSDHLPPLINTAPEILHNFSSPSDQPNYNQPPNATQLNTTPSSTTDDIKYPSPSNQATVPTIDDHSGFSQSSPASTTLPPSSAEAAASTPPQTPSINTFQPGSTNLQELSTNSFQQTTLVARNFSEDNNQGITEQNDGLFKVDKDADQSPEDSKQWFTEMEASKVDLTTTTATSLDAVKIEIKTEEKPDGAPIIQPSTQSRTGERKRKSRWGDSTNTIADTGTKSAPALPTVPPSTAPIIKVPGMSGYMISKVTRTDPGLLQYTRTAYGSTNLSEEDWKKAEDNYKVHLLYQDMMAKREQVERLRAMGKNKYEYDSDEETDGGTWEHKLREKEMDATKQWAESLTEMAKGKHHIGDFLPPDELKRFMDKYSAIKGAGEPDLSDYKEFKLKEDNKGFQMLQKLGWTEGQGLGSDGGGILDPINKAQARDHQGLGLARPGEVTSGDDEYDAYRKRMMLAYRFRPNPLNNPRRPYY